MTKLSVNWRKREKRLRTAALMSDTRRFFSGKKAILKQRLPKSLAVVRLQSQTTSMPTKKAVLTVFVAGFPPENHQSYLLIKDRFCKKPSRTRLQQMWDFRPGPTERSAWWSNLLNGNGANLTHQKERPNSFILLGLAIHGQLIHWRKPIRLNKRFSCRKPFLR